MIEHPDTRTAELVTALVELPSLTLVVAIVVLAEATVSEPPERLHPVVWLGRAIAPVDRAWGTPLSVGAIAAVVYPLAAGATAFVLVVVAETIHPLLGVLSASALVFSATSLRMLLGEARAVIGASVDDLPGARRRLPALAGRESTHLDGGQVRSAAVESAAENLADGLVAPLLALVAFAPVSLALGVAAAWWVKGVNTLDSMLGYRSKAVGTASARLDDLVMWLPARVSALLIAAATLDYASLSRARKLSTVPDSPNSGWPMGALAAALDVRLEKPGSYELHGGPDLPGPETAMAGVRAVGRAGGLAYAVAGAVGVVLWL